MSDYAPMETNAVSAVAPQPTPSRRGPMRFALLVLVPALVALVAAAVYLRGGRYIETENAYVKADKVPVSAEVAGTVRELLVNENQAVTAGQPLFRLDAAPFRVAVAKAEAKLAQVRTELAEIRATYKEKQADITVACTRQAFALKDELRQAELVSKNFVSASRFDDAKQTTVLAGQQTAALEQSLARIAVSLGGSAQSPVQQHPTYLAAKAELEQAQLDLARVEVRAPIDGTVSKPPKLGQYVAAGSTAMALVGSKDLWIEANFTETELTYMHPGQPVTIHVDTYPDQRWRGEVESLSPATGAEFSVIPAQNATGNWVKIAQRVPVKIKIVRGEGLPALRAGLSTTVEIDTGHRRRLLGLSL